jgi:hypothetical protein
VFEKMVLRRIFKLKKEDVLNCFQKLHNEEVHNCTLSQILLEWSNQEGWGQSGDVACM